MVKLERQRYILFKIIIENDEILEKNNFLKSIWQSIWRYFGMKVANKIGLWLVELDFKEAFGIIRCSNETKEVIITALAFINEINRKRIIISTVKTASSIKKINMIKNRLFKHSILKK